jgi:hypothetical protein
MSVLVKRLSTALVAGGCEDFGIRDQKARDVGYRWAIHEEKLQVLTEEQAHSDEYRLCFRVGEERVGLPYRLSGSPTRNRRSYGPSTLLRYYKTFYEAEQNAMRRIANARKRDSKKFAKENA